jgi:hypothetical protein
MADIASSPCVVQLENITLDCEFPFDEDLRIDYSLHRELTDAWAFAPLAEELIDLLRGCGNMQHKGSQLHHPEETDYPALFQATRVLVDRYTEQGFAKWNGGEQDSSLVENLRWMCEGYKDKADALTGIPHDSPERRKRLMKGWSIEIKARVSVTAWRALDGTGAPPLASQVLAALGLMALNNAIGRRLQLATLLRRKEWAAMARESEGTLAQTIMRVLWFIGESHKWTVRQNVPVSTASRATHKSKGTTKSNRKAMWESIEPRLKDRTNMTPTSAAKSILREHGGEGLPHVRFVQVMITRDRNGENPWEHPFVATNSDGKSNPWAELKVLKKQQQKKTVQDS